MYQLVKWSRLSMPLPGIPYLQWLAMKNRLATCDRITKWTQTSIPCVCLMQMAMGIVEHLFFSCSYSAFM